MLNERRKSMHIYTIKFNFISKVYFLILFFNFSYTAAQTVLFDFDNIPIGTTFPMTQTVGSITAHFAGTGNGYSIQDAAVLGFTPPGFSGHIIYPNSIYLADLLIRFDQTLSNFSIMYSVQELACDTSATMRITAYLNGSFVGTETKIAAHPGTWPVDSLIFNSAAGFDSVVIHYDSTPPGCQDYGVIYMADNMKVIPVNATDVSESRFPKTFNLGQNFPNPFNPSTTIDFQLPESGFVTLKVYNILGREITELIRSEKSPGYCSVNFNASQLAGGVYVYQLRINNYVASKKMILLK